MGTCASGHTLRTGSFINSSSSVWLTGPEEEEDIFLGALDAWLRGFWKNCFAKMSSDSDDECVPWSALEVSILPIFSCWLVLVVSSSELSAASASRNASRSSSDSTEIEILDMYYAWALRHISITSTSMAEGGKIYIGEDPAHYSTQGHLELGQ